MNRPTAADLLETPGALLTRTHLRELGLERRAVDARLPPTPCRRPPRLLPAAHPGQRLPRLPREPHLQRRHGEAVTCTVCGGEGRHVHRCARCGGKLTVKGADWIVRQPVNGGNTRPARRRALAGGGRLPEEFYLKVVLRRVTGGAVIEFDFRPAL